MATIPRSVAGVRRAYRRARKRIVRQEAQLRSALADAERNLGVGIASRDRNVKLAFTAREIMNSTRSERERILLAAQRKAMWKERATLAMLVASLGLLLWSGRGAF